MSSILSISQFMTARGLPVHRPEQLIPVCCVCGLVRDNAEAQQDGERWVTKRSYVKDHGVNLTDCHFTHTYCSACAMDLTHRTKPEPKIFGSSAIMSQLLAGGGQLGWLRRFMT